MTTRLFSVSTTLDGAPVLCEGWIDDDNRARLESVCINVYRGPAIYKPLDLIDYLTPTTLDALRDKCEAQLEGSKDMQRERFR